MDLKEVIEIEDKKNQKLLEAKEKNKDKYTVGNNFTPRLSKQKAKKGAKKA